MDNANPTPPHDGLTGGGKSASTAPPWFAMGLPLLGLLFVAGGIVVGYQSFQHRLVAPVAPGRGGRIESGVITGQLAWRDIAGTGSVMNGGSAMPHRYEKVLAGDFDGGGTDELLVSEYGTIHEILKLDGTLRSTLPAGGDPPQYGWDCNGDGKQEILRGTPNGTEALDSTGQVVKTLPYWCNFEIGDVDGDGKPELWAKSVDFRDREVHAINCEGKSTLDAPMLEFAVQSLACDYDGNGKCVLIQRDYSGNLQATGLGGTRQLGNIGQGVTVAGCTDVNGDGRPDLLCGPDSYFDHATASLVKFQTHTDFEPPYSFNFKYVLFDVDGDGVPEGVYAGPDAVTANNPTALRSNGRLRIVQLRTQQILYDEVLKGNQWPGIAVARDHGKQYLVVAEGDKLLIYP